MIQTIRRIIYGWMIMPIVIVMFGYASHSTTKYGHAQEHITSRKTDRYFKVSGYWKIIPKFEIYYSNF